jgi:hypothetical protein
MSLTLKDGRQMLVIDQMEIETKTEAKSLSAMIEKWAESLPDSKPRTRTKARKTPSRRTAPQRSPKANGDTEATQTSLV